MNHSKRLRPTPGFGGSLFVFIMLALFCASVANAQTERLIHSFGGPGDGTFPQSALTPDGHGNLFGNTFEGGTYGAGTVFELSPPAQGIGPWVETIIYSFSLPYTDGCNPSGALAIDKSGNVYGAALGGTSDFGLVYVLTPPSAGSGSWTESIIYNFAYHDGYYTGKGPGGVALLRGNLYVTTEYGGEYGSGNVLELKPPVANGGAWLSKEIFSFGGYNSSDGGTPLYQGGALIADAKGNLYGTAAGGDGSGSVTVFELSQPASGNGSWTDTVLSYLDSATVAPLIFDQAGNLYVTADSSQQFGPGAVYRLSPPSYLGGSWTSGALYTFNYYEPGNGWYTPAGLVFDKAGNLYGVTSLGGTGTQCGNSECGTVFELSPQFDAPWTLTTLYSFAGGTRDASDPFTALTIDPAGHLYGIAAHGGAFNGGAAFEVVP